MSRLAFIIGSGRSGSSMLHDLLGHHPLIGWMSRLCESDPRRPSLNRAAITATGLPILGPLMRRRFPPYECYKFFDVSYPGFSVPVRDLVRSDVTNRALELRERLPAVVPADRQVLIVKITGWPRLGFLDELFPEARFIHLFRDGRAVANSLLQVPWWHGWQGPQSWRMGPLPEVYQREWEQHNKSFPALAAIEWKLVMEALESVRSEVSSDRLLDVRYEDLCADSTETMERIASFLELPWSRAIERAMRRDPPRNRNSKWREDLGEQNGAVVEAVLGEALERYGYEMEPG